MAAERFPIEEGHVMLFARSIGDPNPVYHDRSYAATTEFGGIIAPPTFVQASAQFDPTYNLRPRIGEPWFGSGAAPTGIAPGAVGREGGDDDTSGAGGTELHAEQHFTYHRPLRARDVLRASSRLGERWERQGRRGGTLFFTEIITDYLDEAGKVVVTARLVGVRTERPVEA